MFSCSLCSTYQLPDTESTSSETQCFSVSLLGTRESKKPRNIKCKFPESSLSLFPSLLPRRLQNHKPSSVCKQAGITLQEPPAVAEDCSEVLLFSPSLPGA